MKELIRTNDLILISRIQSILINATIHYELLDVYASTVEGSINAIQKRIVVSNDDFNHSQELIHF
jgi:hypothetical protein